MNITQKETRASVAALTRAKKAGIAFRQCSTSMYYDTITKWQRQKLFTLARALRGDRT